MSHHDKPTQSPVGQAILILLLGVIYFATAKMGLIFAFAHTHITALWPPSGIAFVAFFLMGRWVWPAILLGDFVANLSTGTPMLLSAVIGVGNTLGPLIGAELLRRTRNFRPDFSRTWDVAIFGLFGIALCPIISASIGVLALHFWKLMPLGKTAEGWLAWWSGDAMGVLVLAPIFLLLKSTKLEKPTWSKLIEAIFLIGSFVICSIFIFTDNELLTYLIYPFGLWAVIRFQQLGIVTLAAIMAFVSIPIVILKVGPEQHLNPSTIQFLVYRLQLFISTACMSGMILAAARADERQRAEDRLNASELRYRYIVETAEEGIWAIDAESRTTLVNAKMARMLGYTCEEMIGLSMYDFMDAEAKKIAECNLGRRKQGAHEDHEFRLKHKNGGDIWTTMATGPILDASGKYDGALAIVHDITDRKQAEEERKKALDLLQKIASRVPGVVYQYLLRADGSSAMPFASEATRQIFRVSPEEVRNDATRLFQMIHPDDVEKTKESVQFSATHLTTWSHEYRVKFDDGTVRWLFGNSVPEKTEDGGVLWHGFITDITERKKLEESVANANRNKDLFLATLSHELRTPLATILTWVQMLQRRKLDPEQIKHGLNMLERSANAQRQIIDDLLDVSRIQAGKLNLQIEEVDPAKVITEAIDSTRDLAVGKSIQFETSIDPSVGAVIADPFRLQQILWNLINNSIKFSNKEAKIFIGMDRDAGAEEDRVRIRVRDHGKGIKPEFLPIIFERFTQVDSSSTRVYGGLGLGLAIVRSLVEMHQGSVEVDSDGEDQGTTFTIFLPTKQLVRPLAAKEVMSAGMSEANIKGLKVLVVEDDVDAREVFAFMLQTFGVEVKSAESAARALEVFETFKPDVLVSDIAMPNEDGYSLIRKIRTMKSKLNNVPAIALTAYAGQDDVDRAHLVGFQAHLAKPVEANRLAGVIAKLAGR